MRAALVAYVVCGGGIIYLAFDRLGDRSAWVAWGFFMLFLCAVVFPAWWTELHRRTFEGLGVPLTHRARMLIWSPIMVGATTLATALGLLW